MKKITLNELKNKKNQWSEAVIVFTRGSFKKIYSLNERSYKIKNNSNYFDSSAVDKSLIADCLDGKDSGIRLDYYMDDRNGWIVEYCYILR